MDKEVSAAPPRLLPAVGFGRLCGVRTVTVVVVGAGLAADELEAGLAGSAEWIDVLPRAADAPATVDVVHRRRPDVAVVDLASGPSRADGAAALVRDVLRASPSTRVLAVSAEAEADTDDAVDVLSAGAIGVVPHPRRATAGNLAASVLSVASGHVVVPGKVMAGLVGAAVPRDRQLLDVLAPEHTDLWRMVADGLETTQIAERLYVSERTAKRMVAFLLRRLGVANRIQAAALAGQAGLLDDVAISE